MLVPGADRLDVLLGALLGGGVMLVFALLPGNGIGDTKLGLFMGLALGSTFTLPALLIMAYWLNAFAIFSVRTWMHAMPIGVVTDDVAAGRVRRARRSTCRAYP